MDRRRVIDEAISTLQLKEELDWDKLLWMPGEKKFFLPSIEIPSIHLWMNWDYDRQVQSLVEAARRSNPLLEGRWEGFCDECIGADTYRDEYLGISREERPVVRRYRDVQRSETPMWRATHPGDPRSLRVPLETRPSFYTEFNWGKK